ncbi:MAG: GNAT family N-acetyltransferase [Oscillospiraceae bacterium]|nr:GNAT family N-acetyltransferase [Oscillospiraceae bacterium]
MEHKGTVTLSTERLILRRFTVEDAPAMFANWVNDEKVTRFLTWPVHGNVSVTENILDEWVKNYQNPDCYNWAITLKDNPAEPIGSIAVVRPIDEKLKIAVIGYCLSRSRWHTGIMTEALGAVIDFMFDEVGVNKVASFHDPRNPHSGAVMKKCGMKYEGTLRQADINNQGICDACCYGLLADERR